MASPVFQSAGTGVNSAGGTSLTITAPSGIVNGDLLIAFIGRGTVTSTVSLAGWTQRSTVNHDGGSAKIFTKVASGESGNYTFTWTGSSLAAGGIIRVNGWSGGIPFPGTHNAWNVGNSTAPDGPATPNNPADDYLHVEFISQEGKGGGRFVLPPAGMTNRVDVGTSGGGNPADHHGVGIFTVPFTGISENRVAASSSVSDGWAAQALVVAPVVVAPAITGTSSRLESPDTSNATGTNTPPPITGSAAVTEQADTASTSASNAGPIVGSAAITELADTSVASGTGGAATVGTAAIVELADTSSASGTATTPAVDGNGDSTEQADTSTASGTVTGGPAGIFTLRSSRVRGGDRLQEGGAITTPTTTGSGTPLEQADTSSASGVNTEPFITGTAANVETADTSAASGTANVTAPNITGTANVFEQPDTSTGNGVYVPPAITGTATIIELADTATTNAISASPIFGTAAIFEQADTSSAFGGEADLTFDFRTPTYDGVHLPAREKQLVDMGHVSGLRLYARMGGVPQAYSVLIIGSVASTYPGLVTPPRALVDTADRFFQGGLKHTVSSAEKAILEAEGYTVG